VAGFFTGFTHVETGTSEPCETQRNYVVAGAGCSSDARPQASSFLIVLPFLDPHSHGVGLEIEEEITHVELDEFGDTKGAYCSQGDDGDISDITQGGTGGGEHSLEVCGGDCELVTARDTTQAFERLGPGFDFLLVVGEG
jgi:hypothetical protein